MESRGDAWDDAIRVIDLSLDQSGEMLHLGALLADQEYESLMVAPELSRVSLCAVARMIPALSSVIETGWNVSANDEFAKFGIPALPEMQHVAASVAALPRVNVLESGSITVGHSDRYAVFTMPCSADAGIPLLPRPGTQDLASDTIRSFHTSSHDSIWSNSVDASMEYVDIACSMAGENELRRPDDNSAINDVVIEQMYSYDGALDNAMQVRLASFAGIAL